MQGKEDKPIPFDKPLDVAKEYISILSVFEESGRELTIERNVATIDSISNTLTNNPPLILHISCHGMIQREMKNQVSLVLEPTENNQVYPICHCDKVSEKKLRQRF